MPTPNIIDNIKVIDTPRTRRADELVYNLLTTPALTKAKVRAVQQQFAQLYRVCDDEEQQAIRYHIGDLHRMYEAAR